MEFHIAMMIVMRLAVVCILHNNFLIYNFIYLFFFIKDTWQCRFDEMSCSLMNKSPCMPSFWRCDGLQHCPDGSDETNCPDTCSNNDFYCTDERRCIPETWRCDGKVDCSGEEDEKLCDCPLDSFKCRSGGCTLQEHVCDGIPHCPDYSDERECFKISNSHKLSSISNTSNFDIVINYENTSEAANILTIKRNDGQYLQVCSDNWSLNMSHYVCSYLGYVGATNWKISTFNNSNEYFIINSNNSAIETSEIVINELDETTICKSGIVSINCDKYCMQF